MAPLPHCTTRFAFSGAKDKPHDRSKEKSAGQDGHGEYSPLLHDDLGGVEFASHVLAHFLKSERFDLTNAFTTDAEFAANHLERLLLV